MIDLFRVFIRPGWLIAAAIVLAAATLAASPAAAQQIVVVVSGEPISALDIEQRSKLILLSTHKAASRQEVLDELIDEKLKLREARRWGLDIPESEVEGAFATMAGRMRYTAEQLTQALAKSGVNANTLKARIRSDVAWQQLVRGRFQTALQIGDKELLTAAEPSTGDDVGYDYTLRPILFVMPAGAPEAVIEARVRDAEALRHRFRGCEEGIPFARQLRDVAVREQFVRSSADLPPQLRKVLEGIEIGRLTAPEVTKLGVEMFAICARKDSAAENTPGKRRAREHIFAQRFEERSKQYLQELRRAAMLEYK